MKLVLFAAGAAFLALPLAVSAKSPEIVVSPKPVQEWIADTGRQLDRNLDRIDLSRADAGISIVRFIARADGRPTSVMTMTRGPADLDRVARIAVRRLRLEPLSGVHENQVYEAAIVLGDTPDQVADLRKRAAAYAAERNAKLAARGLPNTVISLGAVAAF